MALSIEEGASASEACEAAEAAVTRLAPGSRASATTTTTTTRVVMESDSHLEVRVPRSSGATSRRLLCVSDTHDQHMFMPRELPFADILVHAGDFTCRGAKDELDSFCAWTDDLLARGVVQDIVVVAGNHEISFELAAKREAVRKNQEAMKRAATERPHVHYLQDSACEVQGITFWGAPWCTTFGRDWAWQLADTPAEQGARYADIPEGIDVLVTHQPPFGQGDWNGCDKRTGSRTLLDRVVAVRPALHIFGHIHTGHGLSSREDIATLFINAAICDEDYKPVQKPILVDFGPEGDLAQPR